jgi:hypothetical protein
MTLGVGNFNLVGLYRTAQDLDARFGSGTYNIILSGTSIPLTLAGDAYPDPPYVTFAAARGSMGSTSSIPSSPSSSPPAPTPVPRRTAPSSSTGTPANYSQGTNLGSSASVTIPANTFTTDDRINFIVHFSTFVDGTTRRCLALAGLAGVWRGRRRSAPREEAAGLPDDGQREYRTTVSNAR